MGTDYETLRQKLILQLDTELLKKIGERIRTKRIEKGYTQASLMEEMGYSVTSRQTVANWENGTKLPDLDHLLWMCDKFNCEMGYLLCEEGYEGETRAITDIQKKTGLSEKAIKQILTLKEIDEKMSEPWMMEMLNLILVNMVDFSGLLAQMNLYLKVVNGDPPKTNSYSKKVLERYPDAKPDFDSYYLSDELRKMGWIVTTPKEFSREKLEDCIKMLKKMLEKMADEQKKEEKYHGNN